MNDLSNQRDSSECKLRHSERLFAGTDLVVIQLITYSWKQNTKFIGLTRHVYLTQFINVYYS
jgi:hypothetical protein